MKKTGAELLVYALEQIGVTHTFGVPGVHNTEIYDALNDSNQITPVLVTHEGGGAFMADGLSRTTDGLGTLVIVPAAGLTQAMSGIAEAYLDGIPMLVISGGVRRDSGRHYQLHQIDQEKLLGGMIKKYYLLDKHNNVIPTVYDACRTATSGEPGPVFIEVPVELQLFRGEVDDMPVYRSAERMRADNSALIDQAVEILEKSSNPGIYVGWGAVDAMEATIELSEKLNAPVATTLQGLSSFPADHPHHTGVGFGPSAVPAGMKAFKNCDCLLAAGVRFSELATGSYGMEIPEKLIHIDINPDVFQKNYPAVVTIESDAKLALGEIASKLKPRKENARLKELIQQEKTKYLSGWFKEKQSAKVSPGFFFRALRETLSDDDFVVVDDGKHTFLTAELLPCHRARHFISPTDFNCMGYCVPAAIGTKLGNPDQKVVGIVGDGAFLMTGLELMTSVNYQAPVAIFVFHDGELGQISQFQKTPLNRKTCTVLGELDLSGIARAVGCRFLKMEHDLHIEDVMSQAMAYIDQGETVLVDVQIDYSRKTRLTKGVVKVNLGRFPFKEKLRFIYRALKRHAFGRE
ncbi:MAG: acetolactate synthase large subunit [Acidobacteria bacterium]|nr:MAG: acetolactate synthase large subunit [Acidobacteriota bacterium]